MIVSNPKTWLVAPGVGVLKAIGLVLLTLSLTTNFGYKVYSSYFTRVLVYFLVCWKVYFGLFGILLPLWSTLFTHVAIHNNQYSVVGALIFGALVWLLYLYLRLRQAPV